MEVMKCPMSRKYQMYFKLIDLYKGHECLWMENHHDFLNLHEKECAWENIANEMRTPLYPMLQVERWKRLIHIMRYKMNLERLREQEAKFYNKTEDLPPRLSYGDKMQFLFSHMFDKKTQKAPQSTTTISLLNTEELVPQESLAAKCMRMGRGKLKGRLFYSHKLKMLETLRNRQRSTFSLTPEAFSKLNSKDKL